MSDKKHNKKKRPLKKCRMCNTPKAVISKYGLLTCRRCFKDFAFQIGFRKYD